jgi:hypothetical protein
MASMVVRSPAYMGLLFPAMMDGLEAVSDSF